jgi:hypothetical protein
VRHQAPSILRAILLLVIATILFRLPILINARDVNSDAAAVALQAMHLLRGEWSWLLWGPGYQSAIDPLITAPFFAIFGPSAHVLMIVPILGQIVVASLAVIVLRKRIGALPAVLAVLPLLVVTNWGLTWPILSANRQWCVAVIFAAVWLLDGAAASARPLRRYALGSFLGLFAIVIDLYAVLFAGGMLSLILLCLLDPPCTRRIIARRALIAGGAVLLAAAVFLVSRLNPSAQTAPAELTFERIGHNLELLWNRCLPLALGYGLYTDNVVHTQRSVRIAPMPWLALLIVGGWSLVAGIIGGAVLGITSRRVSWEARRLGIFGFVSALGAITGFIFSVMPVDVWAVRYLGPMFWMAPFALAPLAAWLGARRLALAIAPWFLVATISGWLSYGFYVNGPMPRYSIGPAMHEIDQLRDLLRRRGIRYAAADYWLAYRLTFLFLEEPTIVPLQPDDDRYEPYRTAYLNEPVTALIFHPHWPPERPEPYARYLDANGIAYQTLQAGQYTVLIVTRQPPDRVH